MIELWWAREPDDGDGGGWYSLHSSEPRLEGGLWSTEKEFSTFSYILNGLPELKPGQYVKLSVTVSPTMEAQ